MSWHYDPRVTSEAGVSARCLVCGRWRCGIHPPPALMPDTLPPGYRPPAPTRSSPNLGELERLCAAAAPGPWTSDDPGEVVCGQERWEAQTDSRLCNKANAAFIAAACTALPALVEMVKELKAEIEMERSACYLETKKSLQSETKLAAAIAEAVQAERARWLTWMNSMRRIAVATQNVRAVSMIDDVLECMTSGDPP